MGSFFCPPDSHSTIGHGIDHGPPGPWLEAARALRGQQPRQLVLGALTRGDGVAQRLQARGPGLGQRRATRLQRRGHPRQRVALALHGRRLLALARLEGGEEDLVVAGVVAPASHGLDDHRVAVLHAAQEIEALEHVGEALGIEDDRDDVGLVGRVALAQHDRKGAPALGQPRAEAHEALACDAQLTLGLGQARLPAGELTLRVGQAAGHDGDGPRRGALEAPRRAAAEASSRSRSFERLMWLRSAPGFWASARCVTLAAADRATSRSTATIVTGWRVGNVRRRMRTAAQEPWGARSSGGR